MGQRIEDKYAVGWPDCIFIPPGHPVFFAEAKLITIVREPRLLCTALQARKLIELTQPPHAYGILLGYHERTKRLYAGYDGDPLSACVWVEKPSRLDSTDWPICALLAATLPVDKQN